MFPLNRSLQYTCTKLLNIRENISFRKEALNFTRQPYRTKNILLVSKHQQKKEHSPQFMDF